MQGKEKEPKEGMLRDKIISTTTNTEGVFSRLGDLIPPSPKWVRLLGPAQFNLNLLFTCLSRNLNNLRLVHDRNVSFAHSHRRSPLYSPISEENFKVVGERQRRFFSNFLCQSFLNASKEAPALTHVWLPGGSLTAPSQTGRHSRH